MKLRRAPQTPPLVGWGPCSVALGPVPCVPCLPGLGLGGSGRCRSEVKGLLSGDAGGLLCASPQARAQSVSLFIRRSGNYICTLIGFQEEVQKSRFTC